MKAFVPDNSISEKFKKELSNIVELVKDRTVAEILICRFNTQCTAEFLQECRKLKYLCTVTTGISHIDAEYCQKNNIEIITICEERSKLTKVKSSSEVALIYCMLAARNILDYIQGEYSLEENSFNPNKHTKEIAESNFGIIGMGRIGTYVSDSLAPICKEIRWYDPNIDGGKGGKKAKNIMELAACDVTLISCTYNQDTRDLVNHDSYFKEIGIHQTHSIINIARGPIVNAIDLVEKMESTKNLRYYIDVAESYNDEDRYLLQKSKTKNARIISSPHIAGQACSGILKADMLMYEIIKDKLSLNEDYC